MSDYEMTLNVFVHLLKTQSSLFYLKDGAELIKLIDEQPDDIQNICNAISNWLSEHPEVDEALAEFEEIGERAPGPTKANANIPKYRLDKKHIINTIKQIPSSAKEVKKTTRNN